MGSDEELRSYTSSGATGSADAPRSITSLMNNGVCEYPFLLIKLDDAQSLGDFVAALLRDINAFPHEMLLRSPLIATQRALHELIDETTSALETTDQTLTGLAHNASILKRSLYRIDEEEYAEGLQHNGDERLLHLRRIWLKLGMAAREEQIPFGLNHHLNKAEIKNYQSNDAVDGIRADYAPHNDGSKGFERTMSGFLNPDTSAAPESEPIDLSDQLLGHFIKTKRRAYVLRFPSSVGHVMESNRKSLSPVRQALLSQAHVAYWLKATAVIDERVQHAAQTDTYSLGTSKDQHGQAETIPVDRLLEAGAVFVPPRTINLQQNAFNDALWTKLCDWLHKLTPMLSYTYVHLGVLEKFSASLGVSVKDLLQQLKDGSLGVRFIVISGRGKPHSLPQGELFVNYSAASQYLTQTYTRSPFLLSALSHSARRLKQ